MSILNTIIGWFTSSDENNGPSGAEAVRNAVQEFQQFAEQTFTVTLGEPEIIETGGRYFNDPKVEIPVHDGPFGETQHLVFDLPRTPDDDREQFNEMLSLLGLSFDTMEEMVGREVSAQFIGGNLVVDWEDMEPPEETDNPGEEEEAESDEDSNVNVEEQTITGEADEV